MFPISPICRLVCGATDVALLWTVQRSIDKEGQVAVLSVQSYSLLVGGIFSALVVSGKHL